MIFGFSFEDTKWAIYRTPVFIYYCGIIANQHGVSADKVYEIFYICVLSLMAQINIANRSSVNYCLSDFSSALDQHFASTSSALASKKRDLRLVPSLLPHKPKDSAMEVLVEVILSLETLLYDPQSEQHARIVAEQARPFEELHQDDRVILKDYLLSDFEEEDENAHLMMDQENEPTASMAMRGNGFASTPTTATSQVVRNSGSVLLQRARECEGMSGGPRRSVHRITNPPAERSSVSMSSLTMPQSTLCNEGLQTNFSHISKTSNSTNNYTMLTNNANRCSLSVTRNISKHQLAIFCQKQTPCFPEVFAIDDDEPPSDRLSPPQWVRPPALPPSAVGNQSSEPPPPPPRPPPPPHTPKQPPPSSVDLTTTTSPSHQLPSRIYFPPPIISHEAPAAPAPGVVSTSNNPSLIAFPITSEVLEVLAPQSPPRAAAASSGDTSSGSSSLSSLLSISPPPPRKKRRWHKAKKPPATSNFTTLSSVVSAPVFPPTTGVSLSCTSTSEMMTSEFGEGGVGEEIISDDCLELVDVNSTTNSKEILFQQLNSSSTATSTCAFGSRSAAAMRNSYACNVCGHRSPQMGIIQVHLRLHTGEKPFPCNICSASYRQSSGLRGHYKAQHFQFLSYPCYLCGKQFEMKVQLKQHIITCHPGPRRLSCPICGRKYYGYRGLNEHFATHTNITYGNDGSGSGSTSPRLSDPSPVRPIVDLTDHPSSVTSKQSSSQVTMNDNNTHVAEFVDGNWRLVTANENRGIDQWTS